MYRQLLLRRLSWKIHIYLDKKDNYRTQTARQFTCGSQKNLGALEPLSLKLRHSWLPGITLLPYVNFTPNLVAQGQTVRAYAVSELCPPPTTELLGSHLSRLLKVNEGETVRLDTYDFRLMIHISYEPILYIFRVTTFCRKKWFFLTSAAFNAPTEMPFRLKNRW